MLRLAFFWHQHQPYYRDPVTGRAALPWVRLHATKDYYGMARLISEFPKIRATINIVPSLAEQLLRFVDDGASDDWLDVMAPDVGSMKETDRAKLLARGFYAHPTSMIGAFPRYQELQRKRLVGARFAKQDLLDLQVLANLAWMHGTLLAEDPLLVRLREKGREFTEDEKRALLARQREIARDVLPMHRRLEEKGQIEVTSTPYFHPILPLLCDFRSAFEAMPWLTGKLGFEPVSLKEDALVHVDRAVAAHERIFGRKPRGMWPAEGSVSMEAAQIFASRGVRFIATDEEILAHSLGRSIRRDGNGNVLDADLLYRPWRVKTPQGDLAIVFRDHRLSDLFGFHYQRDPAGGVEDFVRRLEWIRDHAPDGALVSVILDGENAWEHYPEGGVPFFRALYRRLSELDWLETVRIGDALERGRAPEALPKLFPGSWIDHNFYIWIGHDEDRRAWRALLEARQTLVEAERNGLPRDKAELAWNAIYIAEGSDWYWWYGDDHSSGMDDIFDAIFRGQLKNVYTLVGAQVPAALEDPIKRAVAEAPYDTPRGFSRITLDGRRTSFYEWHGAGRFRPEQEAGSMERAQAGALVEIGFGFTTEELFLALDFGGRKHTIFAGGGAVHVVFITPRQKDLVVSGPGRMRLDTSELGTVAVDEIVELSVPWSALGAKTGDEVRFFVELRRDGGPVERTPRGFALRVRVPTDDFESREWSV